MLPVHDQLDRIYFEADVLHGYEASVPAAMRGAVAANLHAFMQRALDTDAGRYPSLPRFIAELADLRSAPAVESPDEGVVGDASDAVHIHTVHGAKGLEAPIVWLLDAASGGNNHGGYETLLDWPAGEPRPNHFSVWSRKARTKPTATRDSRSRKGAGGARRFESAVRGDDARPASADRERLRQQGPQAFLVRKNHRPPLDQNAATNAR